MTAFMITMSVLHLVSVGVNMNDLTNKSYPYVKTKDKSDDVISLMISLGFAIWAGMLLLG